MIQIYPLFRLQQLDSRIASLEHQLGAAEGNAEIEKKIRIRERKLGKDRAGQERHGRDQPRRELRRRRLAAPDR